MTTRIVKNLLYVMTVPICFLTLSLLSYNSYAESVVESGHLAKTLELVGHTFAMGSSIHFNRKLDESILDIYSKNNILFYDPNGGGCISYVPGSYNGEEVTFEQLDAAATREDKMDLLIKTYGDFALSLQKEYGVPWEVMFAQTIQESEIGSLGVALAARKKGYYNFLGLVYSSDDVLADGGNCAEGAHTHKACYSSMSKMFQAWTISFMHNGRYNAAFAFLNPDNYDLDGFLSTMAQVYALDQSGDYAIRIKSLINSSIETARVKYGLPTSKEFAVQNHIPIGGNWPLDPTSQKGNKKEIFQHLSDDKPLASNNSNNAENKYCADGENCTKDGFTLYSQSGGDWGSKTFGDGNIGSSGSGLSAFAMIATNLLHRKVTPLEIWEYSMDHNIDGPITAAQIQQYAEKYSLESKDLTSQLTSSNIDTEEIINNYLSHGWVIEIALGAGSDYCFTHDTQFVVIRESTPDGKWRIATNPIAANTNCSSFVGDSDLQSGVDWDPAYIVAHINGSTAVAIRQNDFGSRSACSSRYSGGLATGGFMTAEEADKAIMEAYRSLKDTSTNTLLREYGIPKVGCDEAGKYVGHTIFNCVGFSMYFINQYTDLRLNGGTVTGLGDGGQVVDNLSSRLGLPTGSEPQPYAIFSFKDSGWGHTGVVLGVPDENTMILGEASCIGGRNHIGAFKYERKNGVWYGVSNPNGMKNWGRINSTYKFAYTDGHMKGAIK